VLDKLFRPYRSRHSHQHGASQHWDDQALLFAADAGVSFISESFAKDYVKAGEVKLLTVEGVIFGASLVWFTGATAACHVLRRR